VIGSDRPGVPSLAGWAVLGQGRGPRSRPARSADRRRALPTLARGAGHGTHQDGRKQRQEVESILRAVRFFLHRSAQLGGRRAREVGTVGGAVPDPRRRAAGSSSVNDDARSGWTTGCASGNRCCPCWWPTCKTATATYGRCCRPPLTPGRRRGCHRQRTDLSARLDRRR
jgi:hypothetical protein